MRPLCPPGNPTVGGLASLGVNWALHRHTLPKQLPLPSLHPASMLADVPGAWFAAANLLTCLALLAAAPALGWPLWVITAVCAAVHMAYNAGAYLLLPGVRRWLGRLEQQPARATLEMSLF
jgi:hypothetical protein